MTAQCQGGDYCDEQCPGPGKCESEGATVTSDVAAHVLWHLSLGGYAPGSFTRALLLTWDYADAENRCKFDAGWPDYALAMAHARPGRGPGVEWLRALVVLGADGPPEPAYVPVRREVDGKWQTVEITLSEFRRTEGADGRMPFLVL